MKFPNGEFMRKSNTTKAQAYAAATIKTIAQAEVALKEDLADFSNRIKKYIKVPLTANQFSACVSLSYNIGDGAFSRSSVLEYINAKDFANAAKSFALWNKGGDKVLPGLVKRRAEEASLFLKK
jgi:lysozyme